MDITYGQADTSGSPVIGRWHVAVGDRVKEGDPLAEIESDKVELVLESPASGVVAEIFLDQGDEIAPGSVLGRIEEDA